MVDTELEPLIRQIGQLSREFRDIELRLAAQRKRSTAVAVSVLAVFVIGGSIHRDDEVSAKAFLLRDGKGQVRGTFELSENGEPSLRLLSMEGEDRLRLALGENDTGQLIAYNRDGVPLVFVGMSPSFEPELLFLGNDGGARVTLTSKHETTPGLKISDRDGRLRAVLGLDEKSQPSLVFKTANEKTFAAFGQTVDGLSILELVDKEGEQVIQHVR